MSLWNKIQKYTVLLIMTLLAYLSFEILLRRWFFHQLPTQMNADLVYGLLAFNLLFIAWYFFKVRAQGAPK